MVVDVVFRHWISIVMEEAMVSKGFYMDTQRMSFLFYVNYGFIASTCPYWIQWDVDVLTGIFDWVGQLENSGKTVGVVFQISHIFGRKSNYCMGDR